MQSKSSPLSSRLRNLALLGGLSLSLYVVENLIPLPLPWLRIGIGNIGVLLALYILSPLDGFYVLLIKAVLGSLFSARLFPQIIFALGAGIPSYWMMVGVKRLFGRWLSPVGVSVCGAVTHNMLQLGIAWLIVVQSLNIFYLTPVMVIFGTVAGAVIGLITLRILPHLGVDRWKNKGKMRK